MLFTQSFYKYTVSHGVSACVMHHQGSGITSRARTPSSGSNYEQYFSQLLDLRRFVHVTSPFHPAASFYSTNLVINPESVLYCPQRPRSSTKEEPPPHCFPQSRVQRLFSVAAAPASLVLVAGCLVCHSVGCCCFPAGPVGG